MQLTDKHAILEALRAGYPVKSVTVASRNAGDPRLREIAETARARGVPVFEDDTRSGGPRRGQADARAGIVALCGDFRHADMHEMLNAAGKDSLFLALDHVQDPRNLGSILRTAAAASAHGVVLQNRRCCDVTAVVFDTSCGGAARLPIARVSNLPTALEGFKKKNIWVVGADERAETSLHDHDFTIPTCVVLGSEGAGLGRLVRERCDFLVRIPAEPAFPSLNVSVAAAVILFEARRQRRNPRR